MTTIPKPDTFEGVDPGDLIMVEDVPGYQRQVKENCMQTRKLVELESNK